MRSEPLYRYVVDFCSSSSVLLRLGLGFLVWVVGFDKPLYTSVVGFGLDMPGPIPFF